MENGSFINRENRNLKKVDSDFNDSFQSASTLTLPTCSTRLSGLLLSIKMQFAMVTV